MKHVDYTELRIWQKASELAVNVYEITKRFPKDERYVMVPQLRRSSTSVTANIAEGKGRGTARDFRHFLMMARGSICETMSFISLAKNLGYINVKEADAAINEYRGLEKGINSCIHNLGPLD
jgi:four helix bundle protein